MLLQIHSIIRYVVLAAGVLALVYALVGVVARRPYDRAMRILSSVFVGSLDVQILLGIGVIFTRSFYPALIGHITMMIFAAAVVHVTSAVMRRRPPEEKTYMPHLVSILVSLGLIAAGILAIGRGIV